MLVIAVVMLVILLLAGAVLGYVAFPHRGEPSPVLPQLGEVARRAVDSLPTLGPEEERTYSVR